MCDRTSDPTTYDLPAAVIAAIKALVEDCAICDKPESEHGNVDQHAYMSDEQFAQMMVAA
jgi:hypothetical protein